MIDLLKLLLVLSDLSDDKDKLNMAACFGTKAKWELLGT